MDLTENGRIIPEEFIKSFEFLLERESKDSILRQFNVSQPIGWIKVMLSICKLLDRQLLRRLLQYSIS
jgi:ABC-type uncharacterized transport system permease subunit